MRYGRRIVTLGVAALAAGTSLHAQAPAAHASAGPRVQLDGTIERLADDGHGTATALRLPDGERLPLAATTAVPAGGRVRVLLSVPADITDAIRAGRALSTGTGSVRVSDADLAAAADRPAAASSDLAIAVVHDAVADGKPVNVAAVQVFAQALAAGAESATPAVHELTVAIVRPKGLTSSVATASQVKTQVAGADAYWKEQSRGVVSLRVGRIVGGYQSAFSCQDDPFRMWTEAARATGFVEGPNKHLVMVMPREALAAGCSYGLASMGAGVNSGGIAYVADTAWPVLAHEIGHNLGLAHAKSMRMRSVADAATGPVQEYGDPFDVMAASARDSAGSLSVPQAARVGLLRSNEYVDVAPGRRTVTINAVSTLSGVRGIRVRDPLTGAVYWVEYRTRTGRDARLYQPMQAGVRILREESGSNTSWPTSVALDASPTGSSSDVAWALPVSYRFVSYGRGVDVTVLSVRGTQATVAVTASAAPIPGTSAGRVARFGKAAAVRRPAPKTPALAVSRTGVVSWSAVSGARYDVVKRQVVHGAPAEQRTWFKATTRRSARLTGRKGTTVQIKVRARTSAGSSAWSGWTTVAFR